MRFPQARIGLAALAVLAAALLLGASVLSLRAQAARPARSAVPQPAAQADGTRVYVDPVTSSVGIGETLVLSIAIEGAEDLNTYQFDLRWDPAVFTLTHAADAGFLEEASSFYVLDPSYAPPGTLIFGAYVLPVPDQGPGGDGVLATVTLQATGVGTSTLDLDRVSLVDTEGVPSAPDVVDDGWAESTCEPVTVTVAASTPVELGRAVYFTATATGSEPIRYAWDFGGEGTANGEETATPSMLYDAPGLYTATVTATNPCQVDQASIVAEVMCDAAEIDGLTSDSPVEVGETMNFMASVGGTQPITYSWDLDSDGSAERVGIGLDVVTYTYPAVGAYTATLKVDSRCGVKDEATLPVWVTGAGELVRIADLTVAQPAVVGQAVTFTAAVSGLEPITYTWDVDSDGSAEHVGVGLDVVTHTYTTVGVYTVTLDVENTWNQDRVGVAFEVGVREAVRLEVSPADVTLWPAARQLFTATCFDSFDDETACSVAWSVGDANAGAIDAVGVFTAGTPGVYPDAVVGAAGSVTGTADVTVREPYIFLPFATRDYGS